MQSLQELVDTAIQSESPQRPQLVISPNWLTGAGTDSQEVWSALQSLGMHSSSALKHARQHAMQCDHHIHSTTHAQCLCFICAQVCMYVSQSLICCLCVCIYFAWYVIICWNTLPAAWYLTICWNTLPANVNI